MKILKYASCCFLGGLMSLLSTFIRLYVDDKQRDTVGFIAWHGFPIPFQQRAAGFSLFHYDLTLLIANSLLWTLVFLFLLRIRCHMKKRKI